MMRSMFSAVSGLRVHQTKMDVIANNISNVNTNGYKSSRVTFAEMFAQTTAGASGANEALGRGGSNPTQIGLGAKLGSIDMLMTQGVAQTTGAPLDLMIQNNGFFVVMDGDMRYYTRAGSFTEDGRGNIVLNNSGLKLAGWKMVYNPIKNAYERVGDLDGIKITGDDETMPAAVTTTIAFSGNLSTSEIEPRDTSISFYDSLGNKYDVAVRYEYIDAATSATGTGYWSIKMADRAVVNGDTKNPVGIQTTGPAAPATGTGTFTIEPTGAPPATSTTEFNDEIGGILFTTGGRLDTTAAGLLSSLKMIIDPTMAEDPAAVFATGGIDVLLNGLTQYEGKSDATSETRDGNKYGKIKDISIGADGIVTARYTNDQTRQIWQVAIADFKNPAGLERQGNNLYAATTNSGDANIIIVGANGSSLIPGTLEMSNVDLAMEFTEMITTQRGFQANSRVITTSDDMLQELVNLKR